MVPRAELRRFHQGLQSELYAAERQRARLERLAARFAALPMETNLGRDLCTQALCRLATLVKQARQYEERVRAEARRFGQLVRQ